MWRFKRTASAIALAIGFVTLAIASGQVRAASLNVFMQLEREFYSSLVPVTRNFRTCFKEGWDGRGIVALCPEERKKRNRSLASPPKNKKR